MIKLGITGGIGSGKTIVAKILTTMGVPVYISDDEAKRLMVSDPVIITGLKKLIGDDAYIEGQLNKNKIGDYLFSSPSHASKINSLVHPRVKEDFEQWAKQQADYPIVAIESAILFEAKLKSSVDYTILVYASEDTRIERAMKRDSTTLSSVKKKVVAQSKESDKIDLADFLLCNDHQSLLIPQLLSLLREIKPSI